ncbi:PREDICTED: transcription initiation factor IIB-2-like [Lupinus angustifolius]|uniref:transcription initiation factor IIB-2-like n=1 Tax=Lupinus angustifolius TaxID=3871 RepID=UPI00092FA196|nr:PREDICTED: transcription initiation factor IIB-2-like [Lupinus angustifolius]
MEDLYCNECKIYTSIVYDHCAGNTICSHCGLVLKPPSIDNQTFQTQNSNSVGSCSNPLVSNNPPTSGTIDGTSAFVQRKKPMARELKEDSKFSKVFKTMDEIADRLGLVDTIKDCAKEIYKKANEGKIIMKHWKNHKATKVACLYLASQEEGLPRTLKEILTVADGTNVKDIHKVIQMLKGHLEVGRKAIRAKDIARRYCSTLGLNNYVTKAVQEILQKTEEFDIRRNYTSILASVIYMATQLSGNKINLSEIAKVCDVSEGTLKKTFKDLCPLSSVLIPSWYANAEERERVLPVMKFNMFHQFM